MIPWYVYKRLETIGSRVPRMLYIDTNIFIYLFENHVSYSERVANKLEEYVGQGGRLITSSITVTEFLAGTDTSSLETLHQVPNLTIISLDEKLAEQAALLQRKAKIKIGDSIHLATALHLRAEAFFTNDKQLSKIVEQYIPVFNA